MSVLFVLLVYTWRGILLGWCIGCNANHLLPLCYLQWSRYLCYLQWPRYLIEDGLLLYITKNDLRFIDEMVLIWLCSCIILIFDCDRHSPFNKFSWLIVLYLICFMLFFFGKYRFAMITTLLYLLIKTVHLSLHKLLAIHLLDLPPLPWVITQQYLQLTPQLLIPNHLYLPLYTLLQYPSESLLVYDIHLLHIE